MWRALGMGYYRLKDTKEASQWWAKSVAPNPGRFENATGPI